MKEFKHKYFVVFLFFRGCLSSNRSKSSLKNLILIIFIVLFKGLPIQRLNFLRSFSSSSIIRSNTKNTVSGRPNNHRKSGSKSSTKTEPKLLVDAQSGKFSLIGEDSPFNQSKELREEFLSFVQEFGFNYRTPKNASKFSSDSNILKYLNQTAEDEAYSDAELHVRQKHHADTMGQLGSYITDVYEPYKSLNHPVDPTELTISHLLASGAHLGHHKTQWRPSTQTYIYGVHNGIHIIDLEKTTTYLRRAAKVIEGVSEKGGLILFLGTREGQARIVQTAAERCGGYYVSSKWVPGTLTNNFNISGHWERKTVNMKDETVNEEIDEIGRESVIKPDLLVVLNPKENDNALREAMATGIPTIGIIDTDSEPSLVTYQIPANDDSLRTVTLIAGVLSKAAQKGRDTRYEMYNKHTKKPEDILEDSTFQALKA